VLRMALSQRTLGLATSVVLVAVMAAAAPVAASPPSNDDFENATDVMLGTSVQQNTTDATVQLGEPTTDCLTTSGHTVWFRYFAPQNEGVHADTVGSNYDTILTVYQGTQLNNISLVDCNDDGTVGTTSSLDFNVIEGNTYYIQLAGYDTDSGNLTFSFVLASTDRTDPTVTKPLPSVHVGSKLGSGSSRITWSGTDGDSGISFYELQKSSNGGHWTNVMLGSATATSVQISLALDASVQFRVRATDSAGNTSTWKLGPSFTPVLFEDKSPGVRYLGRWTRSNDPNSSGGTHTWTRTAGARASLTFTGRTVAYITPTDYHRGRAAVIVDGVLMATVDLYSGSAHERVVLFSHDWSTVGNHKIVIRNKATPGRSKIDLDTFLVYQ
jgi:hypothetical protein